MESTGSAELRDVYEQQYSAQGEEGMRYGRWRALGARGKADHVARLAAELPERPRTVAEVGCGDGVLLQVLAARRGGGEPSRLRDLRAGCRARLRAPRRRFGGALRRAPSARPTTGHMTWACSPTCSSTSRTRCRC
ncbi:MAG: hypothetical protein WKF40_00725 [Thermoleophilaceae bacterium]